MTACAVAQQGVPAGPADPAAEMRPELFVAPQQAAPGERIGLGFPEHTTRGVHFVLEREDGDTWQYLYDLVSGPDGGGSWFRAGTPGFEVPDIGVAGPGPDRVAIPEVAEPGAYRICTGNARQNFCTPIEIIAP